jgi:N4-(beta-N-acetylglucosaminyl)-L-asparaginase
MNPGVTRRGFLQAALAGAGGLGVQAKNTGAGRGGPVVIASGNGLPATTRATELLATGTDPLDAVIAGVNIVEADPSDYSVGLGGLPNEDGVVELDAAVMHGPTHRAGAVAALRNIKHPSRVARRVMQRTDHVLLVGEGALRFARAHGFPEENLLTPEARQAWLNWKERLSDQDDWLPEADPGVQKGSASGGPTPLFTHGTIHCSALDRHGNLACVTTTSGLSFKLPGRVGDSPIIGAGLYVDNAVGAAGATGRGEAVIQSCGAHAVVQQMAKGLPPQDACLAVLKDMVRRNRHPRLRNSNGEPTFNVTFYAVDKSGRFGAAAIWSDATFAVSNGGEHRVLDCAYLYRRQSAKTPA